MLYNLSSAIDSQRAQKWLSEAIKNKWVVNLSRKYFKRSIPQNKYLHLILTWFALETGYSLEEAKQIYKFVNKDIYEYEKTGKLYTFAFFRSSAALDSKEMTISIDRFREYSDVEAGVVLPTPDDRRFLKEIEIQASKTSLI